MRRRKVERQAIKEKNSKLLGSAIDYSYYKSPRCIPGNIATAWVLTTPWQPDTTDGSKHFVCVHIDRLVGESVSAGRFPFS